MKSPCVGAQLSQTIQRQTDTFADADTCSAHEQQRIGVQVVGAAQFPLEQLIVLERKRARQIARRGRKVVEADEIRCNGMAVGGQIFEYSAKAEQIAPAGLVG